MQLRIVTLNVWNNQGDSAARLELINAELRRLDPDLVALQEVLWDEHGGQLATIVAGTGLHATHQAQEMAVTPPGADRFGGHCDRHSPPASHRRGSGSAWRRRLRYPLGDAGGSGGAPRSRRIAFPRTHFRLPAGGRGRT